MASGRLGVADLTANNDTLIYSVPPATDATVNIRVTNRNAAQAKIYIAIGPGATPDNADYIEYGVAIEGGQPLENTGIRMSAGEKVWVRSTLANVSVRVHGDEGEA